MPEDANLVSSGQVWRVLTVSVGALGSFNEIMGVSKIAKSAIGPLADQNISVLCLSTYQSDYILVILIFSNPFFLLFENDLFLYYGNVTKIKENKNKVKTRKEPA